MFQQLVSACHKCNTRGYTLKACDRCPLCAGRAVVYRPEILEVKIERGMALGQRLVFSGMSDAKPGSRAGDVIFTIVEKKEDAKPFQRIGATNDLLYTQHLTLHEALTGAAFPIIHMDNRVLLVRPHEYGSYAGIIKTGDMVVIRGEGMPVLAKVPAYSSVPRAKAGDLHIIFNVVFPTHDDIAKSEEKKKIFARVVEDLALLQPREPIESVIAGRSVVPVFATKAPAKPTSSGSPADDHRNGADARARRKAEKRKKRGDEDDKNDAESVKCHQQ
jgi:DnaJ-class molecular chaperone